MIPTNITIILFDGECVFCNRSMRFIMDKDTKKLFHYAALQSTTGKEILLLNNFPSDYQEGIVVYSSNKIYTKEQAVLYIAEQLGGMYNILSKMSKPISTSLLSTGYNFIAKNRYRWFGKQNTCDMPNKEVISRLLP